MSSKVSSISVVGPAACSVNNLPVLPIVGFHLNWSHTLVSWSLRIKKGRKKTHPSPALPLSTDVASVSSLKLSFPIYIVRVALAEL